MLEHLWHHCALQADGAVKVDFKGLAVIIEGKLVTRNTSWAGNANSIDQNFNFFVISKNSSDAFIYSIRISDIELATFSFATG